MVRLILFGPPGSGKGTQAASLSSCLQVPHISTGELLRAAVANNTSLGKDAKAYLDRGELVPDAVVIDMIRERLSQGDTQSGWLLDGFPRNLPQADALDALLAEIGQEYEHVVNLQVPEDVLVARMMDRGRKDDTEKVIRRRLQVYQTQTAPLIQFYGDRDRLVNINGNQTVDTVTANIKDTLSSTH